MQKLRPGDVFVDPYRCHWRAIRWTPGKKGWNMMLRSLRQPGVVRDVSARGLYNGSWYQKVGQNYRGRRKCSSDVPCA